MAAHCNRGTPGTKKKKAQNAVTKDVARLPEHKVPGCKVSKIDPKEEVQERIKNPACFFRRQGTGGFEDDHAQPEQRR
jgi:hypothetical protein